MHKNDCSTFLVSNYIPLINFFQTLFYTLLYTNRLGYLQTVL